VYSDADEVELLVNGRSHGRRPAGRSHRYRAEFTVDYEPGTIEAVAVRNGEPHERTTIRSASAERKLVAIADRTRLQHHPDELAFVAIEVADEQGTRATDAGFEVTVHIEGPGLLQGFGSGAPTTTGSYTDDRHDLFDGRALAVIRPTGPGRIQVTARSRGYADAVVSLTVQ
jgi:hypothetical protein